MYVARINKKVLELFDAETGALKRIINCAIWDGIIRADTEGDLVSIVCGDRRTRVYDIKTGFLKTRIQRSPY